MCTLHSEPPEKSRPQYTGEETAVPLQTGALRDCSLLPEAQTLSFKAVLRAEVKTTNRRT